MEKIIQTIPLTGTGLNSDDSLELMPVGDSPTTFASAGRQNVIVPPDNFGKLEDAWGTTLVTATNRDLGTKYMGHAVDTDGEWCYYFLMGTGGSIDSPSLIGVNLRDGSSVRVVMEYEPELELDSTIVFKKAAYIDGWIYWASGQYGPKKIHVDRAINFTTYKNSAWDSTASYSNGDKVLYTDGGIYEVTALAGVSAGAAPPPLNADWELDSYAYPNTAISGEASLLDGAFDLVELPPIRPVTGEYSDDTSRLYNNLRGKMFQFTYRWKYRDGGFSNTAPFSELFLPPDVESYNGEILNSFATNNVLTLYFDGGMKPLIEYVELYVRMGAELSWQYVDKIDAGTGTYAFYNDYIMEVASDDMVNKLDNYIPRETRALELLSENVLALGGNTYGFDNIMPSVNLTVGWEGAPLNAPAASPDITYTLGTSQYWNGTYYNKVLMPVRVGVDVGDILIIYIKGEGFIVSTSYIITAADVGTDEAWRDAVISVINDDGGTYVRAGYASPPDGMTLNVMDFYVYNAWWYHTELDTASSYISVFTPISGGTLNKWSQFTTGARHVFGITYFDRAMRPFAVASNTGTKIYVPTVVEAYLDGELLSSTSYEHKNHIDWEVKHEAPAEARYWQWFYAGCNIQDFWFYAIDSVSASGTVLTVVMLSLQDVQTDFPLSTMGPYEWAKGDRMRVITKAASAGAYGALSDSVTDLEIKAFVAATGTFTLETTGSATYDLGAGSLVEIYRPQTTANDDLFFAFGPMYETYVYSAEVYHKGETQDQYGITTGQGAKGSFDTGDSYLIARAYKANVITGAAKTDIFLAESKSYSDFYDSDWYEQGKLNTRSNIGEVELNNLAISNKLIQDTGINGLCTFEYDDIVSLPDKNGKINALRQVGNVLRVIQQRKRTSFYVGMTEFYNQDGTSNLVASSAILGNARELDGDWGTEHPETVVKVGDMVFFWDLHNRAMVQDSENGAIAISDNKMRAFFKDFGEAIDDAILAGTDYVLSCDYYSVLQTLFFYYYINNSVARMILYHLPSKRWMSTMTGIETTTTTIAVNYGYLYNWYAATDARNIAADGWGVPGTSDYEVLADFAGANIIPYGFGGNIIQTPNTVGIRFKESGTLYWGPQNTGSINDIGFNARGAGQRNKTTGAFSSLKTYTTLLVNDDIVTYSFRSFGITLSSSSQQLTQWTPGGSDVRNSGMSIRLIKTTTTLSDGQTGTYTGNDGKVYRTICIGTQEWLADNLCETLYRDGSPIPEVTDDAAWAALTSGARCSYNNDETNAFTTTTTVSTDVGGVIGAENRFFIVNDGALHLMDDNADRREYIGGTTKEEAFIKVVGNQMPLLPKTIDTVGVISNQHTGWAVTNVTIPADATTKVDQISLVIDEDWLTREGVTRAPVKRNLYTSGVYSYGNLWEGERMRGRVAEVKFTLPTQVSGKVEVTALEIGMTKSNV